jgi:hypothetical protein
VFFDALHPSLLPVAPPPLTAPFREQNRGSEQAGRRLTLGHQHRRFFQALVA